MIINTPLGNKCDSKIICTHCNQGFNLTETKKCIFCDPTRRYIDREQCLPCRAGAECQRCDHLPPTNFPCSSCFSNATRYKGECKLKGVFNPTNTQWVEETMKLKVTFENSLQQPLTQADFTVSIVDEESNIDDSAVIQSFTMEEDDKTISITLQEPTNTYFKAYARITAVDKDKVVYRDQPYKSLNQSRIEVKGFSYSSKAEKAIGGTAGATSTAMSAVSIIVAAVSIKLSMELLKLYQMFEFLIFLNVPHPINVKMFLSRLKSGALLEVLPDLFSPLHNEECLEVGKKFEDEEMSCQSFANLGNTLQLLLGFAVARLALILTWKLMSKFQKDDEIQIINQDSEEENNNSTKKKINIESIHNPSKRGQKKKRIGAVNKSRLNNFNKRKKDKLDSERGTKGLQPTRIINQENSKNKPKLPFHTKLKSFIDGNLGWETMHHLVTGNNLDLYFAIFLNLKYYKPGDNIAEINSFFVLMLAMALLTFMAFSFSKVFKIIAAQAKSKKKEVKSLKPFEFLVDGIKGKSLFAGYYHVIALLRDPLIAFFVVVFYDIPLVQASGTLLVMGTLTSMEIFYRPLESRKDMAITLITNVCFTLTNLMFLVVSLMGRPANDPKVTSVGMIKIGLLSVVILSNVIPGLYDSFMSMKDLLKKLCGKGTKAAIGGSQKIGDASALDYPGLDDSVDKSLAASTLNQSIFGRGQGNGKNVENRRLRIDRRPRTWKKKSRNGAGSAII